MNRKVQYSEVAILHEAGKPLELKQIALPALRPGEVLVKITASTLCGSDLHTFSGRRTSPMPTILGHEAIGIIVDSCSPAGHDVDTQGIAKDARIGDRVTWSIAASCGCCNRCKNGLLQKCESLFKYGHENSDVFPLSGGLGNYCLLRPGTIIVSLAAEIPDVVAAPANCATSTVAAAFRTAGTIKKKRVLITGAGMLGLTACAFAAVGGAAEIVVCDIDESRLKLATEFGASRVVHEVGEETFDVALEMSGSSAAVSAAIESARVGATIVLVGSVSPSRHVEIDPEFIVRNLISIHGVHNYCPDDLRQAVRFLKQHHARFPFADLVEATFPLQQAQAAFEYAESARPIRVAVLPG